QEAILPPPPLWTTCFRGAPPGTPLRRVAADASLFASLGCRPWGRHTLHPSGARPLDVSLVRHTSAPGTGRAPETRRCPLGATRRLRTHVLAPWRVPFPYCSPAGAP